MVIGGRNQPVPLHEDSMGVFLENDARNIQQRGENEYRVSINPEWLAKLEIAEQGAKTLHSFSLGVHPTVVQNPAIIIQPEAVVNGDGFDG